MTAKTTAERQKALRARRALLEITEVRGLYAPSALHQPIKAAAKLLIKNANK